MLKRWRAVAVLCAATALGPSAMTAQALLVSTCTGCWTHATTLVAPPPRVGGSMAFDRARREVVLFGGFGALGPLRDTWVWNGLVWRQVKPAVSPTARGAAAFAWDGKGLTLFGGETRTGSDQELGDTWSWDGSTWRALPARPAPSPRAGASMAWDGAEVVLFGGWNPRTGPGPGGSWGDTWTFDRTSQRWSRRDLRTHPTPRIDGLMTYNGRTGGAELFGGHGRTNLDDAWRFKGGRWTQLRGEPRGDQIPPRIAASFDGTQVMAYAANQTACTLIWGPGGWRRAANADSPPVRLAPSVAYDESRGDVVVFGGSSATGPTRMYDETWVWRGPAATG